MRIRWPAKRVLVVLALSVTAVTAAQAQESGAAGSAGRGEQVFETQCSLCHGLGKGDPGQGPDLNGIFSRKPAGADYPYSPALKALSAAPWTPQSLDSFLKDPQAVAPGTGMPIKVDGAADRADLIAFLATTK